MRTKENTQRIKYDQTKEPLVINKATLDLLLNQAKSSDLLALYLFYYYTAKWQGTNQPKCTNNYVRGKFKWGEERLLERKKDLIGLNLIENVKVQDTTNGKILGHYIKVHFFIGNDTHTPEKPGHGFSGDKCLKTNNKYKKTKTKKVTQDFEQFWNAWPKNRRIAKSTAFGIFENKYDQLPKINKLLQILELHKKQDQWQEEDGRFIPHPRTWLNQKRWNDEVEGSEEVLNKASIKKINRYQSEDHYLGRKDAG